MFVSITTSKIKGKKYTAVFGNQTPKWNGKRIAKRYIWSHFHEKNIIENMFSKLENRYFFHKMYNYHHHK